MAYPSRGTIAILSIGQMGLGIATLLRSVGYHITTNVSDRSAATQQRAKDAHIVALPTDADLVAQADYIFSIVPPRDALAIAERVVTTPPPLYFLELNAIAPSTARSVADLFAARTPSVRLVDGGIIGAPPSFTEEPAGEAPILRWKKPDIPLSGPYALADAPLSGAHLAETLNTTFIDVHIGSASGLKCSFAALSKGFTALALQSYTSASALGVLPQLQTYLDIYNPGARAKAEKSIVGCTSKAYRWVEEMRQIGVYFGEEGGFREQAQVFKEVAGVYEALASVYEATGGKGLGSAEEVVKVLGQGVKRKEGEEKVEETDK
ncbi:6-phosphogluconate dehydrogenase C-terminal domain-like protein [Pyrenochaeta sp. DS3sAY3a]|nr:6-phosphogluconate dehydrogenase C-terminal domain-like protein [Pyrenochaeta sp. DS3sAY3a]